MLTEKLQEQKQLVADECHARGELSPEERFYESLQNNFNEQIEKEIDNETIKDAEKHLQPKGIIM